MKNAKLIFIILIACQAVFAQNWTGAVNSDWNNNANWSSPPTNGAAVIVNPSNYTGGAFSPIIIANSVFTTSTLEVLNGAILTIGANLTTSDDATVSDANSEIIVNQGVFSVNFSNDGRLIADLGGKITVNGGTVNVGERLISGFDAQITIFNGNVTTNERLLMDLGGKVIIHGGNLIVGQVMALADGDVNGSSYFEQNGGTITVTGEVALENEAGNYQPTILINSGTFNLNGDLVWFGTSPGLGTPRFISTGGVVNINGEISNLPLSTVNLFLDLKGSSQLNFNGTSIDLINVTDSIKQSGNSNIKLSGTHNWNNIGVFFATNGSVLCDGITNLMGTGSYQFNDLTIAATKTLNHTSPFEIFIVGDFSKLGSFNPATNKVTFSGNLSQNIIGNSTFNFASVEINNLYGVSLNHPISIVNSLTLTNGLLNTSTINILTLTATATATSGSNLSFVNGPMKKIGNTAFVFPIGKNGEWRRLSISAPINISSELTAEYFAAPAVNSINFNTPLNGVSPFEYWQLEKSNPSDSPTIELFWENATQSGISNCAATTIAHFNGASWDNVNSSATGICNGIGSGSVHSNSPQTNLGLFTFGYFGNVVSQSFTICNGSSLTVGTNTYTSSGNYIDVLTDVNNNDSTILTSLTVLPVLTGIQNVQVCFGDSFTVGTSTYTSTGNYIDTLISVNGCDSTLTTNLSVLPALISNQNIQICFGDSFTVGTATYTSTGNYIDTLVSVNGCDSLVITSLSVANLIDVTTTVSEASLSTLNTTATSYQWLDCVNNYTPIAGEINPTFLLTANGNYAVEITEGSCKDTSICTLVNSVGISEVTTSLNISIYPNPSSGIFTISKNNAGETAIEIYNTVGKLIYNIVSINEQTTIELSTQPKGIYLVRATTNSSITNLKIIIQ